MNYFILAAGIFATFASIGHFVIGTKDFLRPVLNAEINAIPKNVMYSLFHYMSVFMTFTSVILLSVSMGENLIFESAVDVVKLIGIIYAAFAITQFLIALTSSIKMGVIKLFQWIFWTLIAACSLIGVYG